MATQSKYLEMQNIEVNKGIPQECGIIDARDTHALQQIFSAAVKHGHTLESSMVFLLSGRQLRAL
jgi:hypothetical protein